MKKINIETLKIGIRAQDIQTGLQDVQVGPLDVETKNIRLVGMAERLAIHIRGADVISDCKKLEYIASQLGIEPLALPQVLNVLEELDLVTVHKKEKKIVQVDERVPYFSDIYSLAGDYFKNSKPSEIEEATIEICDLLSTTPITEQTVKQKIGLRDKELKMVLDIGKSGKIINEYTSKKTKETIFYSPLYWIENSDTIENMYKLLKEFGADEVYNALKKIKDYQGLPLTDDLLKGNYETLQKDMKIINEAIRRGIILAPAVDSFKGRRNFAFIPSVGIAIEEKFILEKAMALLACVRYGEHFGLITKIKYPEAILDKLLSPPHRIGSHTEIRRQYAILIGRGIGKIYPDRTNHGKYYFELFPTEENLKAIKLAKSMLKIGEVLEDKGLFRNLQRMLFYPGTYEESLRTLPKLKAPAFISSETQESIQDVLNNTMDILRGA